MTATDEQHERLGKGYPYTLRPELHKTLKARGIDYWVAQGLTFWNCPDGRECVAYGYQSNGKPRLSVKIAGITDPEQAIAATLGAGVCKNIAPSYLDFLCSKCGFVNYRNDENDCGGGSDWHFCPNCGAEVVDE